MEGMKAYVRPVGVWATEWKGGRFELAWLGDGQRVRSSDKPGVIEIGTPADLRWAECEPGDFLVVLDGKLRVWSGPKFNEAFSAVPEAVAK